MNLDINTYADMPYLLSFVAPQNRNKQEITEAVQKLELERNQTVIEQGITQEAIFLDEIISQLKICLKEATFEDYSHELEHLEFVLSINILRAQNTSNAA